MGKTPKKKIDVPTASSETLVDEIEKIFSNTGIIKGLDYQPQPLEFDIIDFYNGKKIKNTDDYYIGLNPGHIISLIGGTNVGKSTLAQQIAAGIVRPYPGAKIIDLDIERGRPEERFAQVNSDWSNEEVKSKYSLKRDGLYIDSIYLALKSLCDLKIANAKKLTVTDAYGNPYLIPTVVILDSISVLYSQKVMTEDAEIGKGHANTLRAQLNNEFVKKLINMIGSANVTLITINHIHKSPPGNTPEPPEIYGLKQGETLNGGKSFSNFADTMLRLDGKDKLEEEKDYGINGSLVNVTIIKSRNARSRQMFTLIFDPINGYNNILSSVHWLRSNKLLAGSPNGYYLDNFPEFKFTFKSVKSLLENDSKLKEKFRNALKEYLVQIIDGNYLSLNNDIPDLEEKVEVEKE